MGTLAEDREFVKCGIEGGIECNMAADALVEPAFEMHAGPFHVGVSTDLRKDSFKLGVIFEDGAGTLVHGFNSEPEVAGIIGACEACLKGGDKLVKGRKFSG